MNIRAALYAWRDNEARAKNIEGFRVFPNATLDAIVAAQPRNKDELCAIKGIKEAKYGLYGKAILNIIAGELHRPRAPEKDPQAFVSMSGAMNGDVSVPERPAYTISEYLDILNRELYRINARVRGEVVSVQERGSALYFAVKDPEAESMLNVFMWISDYRLSGVEITEGLEIIIDGRAEIYKPSGRLSLRAQTIELVGEGALKKAYDQLRKKLESEGLFAVSRKRPLTQFPTRIGVITSKQGAVIHDFTNNLGKFGFVIRFIDSRVEGVLAVKDIFRAIKQMRTENIDALVLIRGGGSLESLQAFNNEHIVRALAEFPKPVICAIGHDKDVPLAQLAADFAPSTPTACTALLNESWVLAGRDVTLLTRTLIHGYSAALHVRRLDVVKIQHSFEKIFSTLRESIFSAINDVRSIIPVLHSMILARKKEIVDLENSSVIALRRALSEIKDRLQSYHQLLEAHDPMRQLRLGYSILRTEAGVLRSVKGLKEGATMEATLADGSIKATITDIETYDKKTTRE